MNTGRSTTPINPMDALVLHDLASGLVSVTRQLQQDDGKDLEHVSGLRSAASALALQLSQRLWQVVEEGDPANVATVGLSRELAAELSNQAEAAGRTLSRQVEWLLLRSLGRQCTKARQTLLDRIQWEETQ